MLSQVKPFFIFILLFLIGALARANNCSLLFTQPIAGLAYFADRDVQTRDIQTEVLRDLENSSMEPYEKDNLMDLNQTALWVSKALVAKLKGAGSSPENVLYPAAGFDASTAFLVFPKAQRVVGIDNHPFYKSVEPPPYKPLSPQHPAFGMTLKDTGYLGYRTFTQIDRIGYMAPEIIHQMQNTWENLRILRVWEIHDRTAPPSDYAWQELSHGIIEFDTGPRTPKRYYIHIHSPLIELHKYMYDDVDPNHSYSYDVIVPSTWWMGTIRDIGFDGLLQKAAMDFLRSQKENKATEILDILKEKGGVLVDGDTHYSYIKDADAINGFGYNDVTITVYKKP